MPGLPPSRELSQRELRGSDPTRRRIGQAVFIADEVHGGLADPVEHMVAPDVQRDEIDIQLISHDDPLPVPGTVP